MQYNNIAEIAIYEQIANKQTIVYRRNMSRAAIIAVMAAYKSENNKNDKITTKSLTLCITQFDFLRDHVLWLMFCKYTGWFWHTIATVVALQKPKYGLVAYT